MAVAAQFLPDQRPPLTVSQLTERISDVIDYHFDSVRVIGQISNFKIYTSGHAYFTLKDEQAEIACVMWKTNVRGLQFEPEDGLEVVADGSVRVYAKRGRYQLYVEQLSPVGIGPQELKFRQLFKKLERQGLFDPRHKKALPKFPEQVCVITSPKGAAIRDIIRVCTQRWPAVRIVLVPVTVQGDGAAEEIAAALDLSNRLELGDVIIVGRGGGSKEDLEAFNEERVARAIFRSQIPVISAVGHEIDTTIADLVADKRAATPSNAAELAVPNRVEVARHVEQLARRLAGAVRARLEASANRLEGLASRPVLARPLDELVYKRQETVDRLFDDLRRAVERALENAILRLDLARSRLMQLNPAAYLDQQERRCADLLLRLTRAMQHRIQVALQRLEYVHAGLEKASPARLIERNRERCEQLALRLLQAGRVALDRGKHRLGELCGKLDTLSPLRVLQRGYSLTFKADGRTIVRTAADVELGEEIVTRLGKGQIRSTVTWREGPLDDGAT